MQTITYIALFFNHFYHYCTIGIQRKVKARVNPVLLFTYVLLQAYMNGVYFCIENRTTVWFLCI